MRRDIGIKVLARPTPRQEAILRPMIRARHEIFCMICNRIEAEWLAIAAARQAEKKPPKRAPKKQYIADLKALRHRKGFEWMRTLSVWSTRRVLDDVWKARSRAFKGQGRMPHKRDWRGHGGVALCYEERAGAKYYAPDAFVYLKGVKRVRVRTGKGYMPKRIRGCPTMTCSVDATGRWWLSFAVPAGDVAVRECRRVREPPAVIGAMDGGVRVLGTLSDGSVVRGVAEEEARERAAQARRVREREKAQGQRSKEVPLRKKRRAAKQVHTRACYAPGGAIDAKRKATAEKERVRRAKVREEKGKARREKAEARKASANAKRTPAQKSVETTNGKTPQRQRCHRGKGSGAQHRKGARKSRDERAVALASRAVARRTPGSRGHREGRVKLAKKHAKVARRRHEHNEQMSLLLVSMFAVLILETLSILAMARGWCGKAVLRSGLGRLLRRIDEKAWRTGCWVVYCGQWFASSKRCHACRERNDALRLSDRVWTWPHCGARLGRDDNGSANLHIEGVGQLAREGHIDWDIVEEEIHRICAERMGAGGAVVPRPKAQSLHKRTRRCRGTEVPQGTQTGVERATRRGDEGVPARRNTPGRSNGREPTSDEAGWNS